jgi:hypothetical protein
MGLRARRFWENRAVPTGSEAHRTRFKTKPSAQRHQGIRR